MPRGVPRKGAYEITLWFEDGARLKLYTDVSKAPMTNQEIASDVRERLLPILARMAGDSDDTEDRT